MEKTVVILQSNYIPWKGYFDLVHDADIFVFYDDVQYTVNDWRNRNKIVLNGEVKWLSVPVYHDIKRKIDEARIASDRYNWQRKHWGSIVQAYSKTAYWKKYCDIFKEAYVNMTWNRLSELNQYLIKQICEIVGITTTFVNSRELDISGDKTERLKNIVKYFDGTTYISGPAAKTYLNEELFGINDINLIYKNYSGYPPYPQATKAFVHEVSVLDLLFNVGPESSYYIWGWRSDNK